MKEIRGDILDGEIFVVSCEEHLNFFGGSIIHDDTNDDAH